MKKWFCAAMGSALLVFVNNAYADYTITAVPEINAASAVTALSVLSGVIALATERLRRK